jgi:SAM-dependent methyltransferase
MSKYYKSDDYASHKNKEKSLADLIYFFIQRIMLRFKMTLIKRHSLGKKLLDYGAGIGNFARYMSKDKYKVFAIEPSPIAMNIAISKGINAASSLKNLPATESFNIITLWHVLEHISSPKKTLAELRSRLEKNGKLIIAVPNFNSFDSQYYQSHWAALDVPRHLWHFTTPGIQILMKEAGFVMSHKYPLWFDAIYIAYLSEQNLGNNWPLLRGSFIGFISNLKAFFSGEYSSLIYVFEEEFSFLED